MSSFEELLPGALEELVDADADQDEPGDPDEPATGGPVEDSCSGLVGGRAGAGAGRAHEDLDRGDAETAVDEPAADAAETIERAVGRLGAVPERGAEEPPDGVAAEADRDDDEQEGAERLVGERPDRALLIGELSLVADGDEEREHADDPVDQSARDEARAREHLEGGGVDEVAAGALGGVHR